MLLAACDVHFQKHDARGRASCDWIFIIPSSVAVPVPATLLRFLNA
jgi:hypothetical protein